MFAQFLSSVSWKLHLLLEFLPSHVGWSWKVESVHILFSGWLKGVPGEPNRAYCLFCKKSLHAHRLSLLKHTCTLKHTKAAQKNFELQVVYSVIFLSLWHRKGSGYSLKIGMIINWFQ